MIDGASFMPPANDRKAGMAFSEYVANHHSTSIVEVVFHYFCNIGEYEFKTTMDPRAFLQFCADSRLLSEDFTYSDAEDIASKFVEDGYDRFDLEVFMMGLSKIGFYKYKLSPEDTAETLLEDHILPLEAEAQDFLARKPWEIAAKNKHHTTIPSQELIHRAYLFYTEEGRPMLFEDFKLFAQDFDILPNCIAIDELRQLFAMSPREWMSVQDFVALIGACASFRSSEGFNMTSFMESLVKHPSMGPVVEWFDSQTNSLPVDNWRFFPQQSTFEPFKPYLDPSRKDEPVRLTETPYTVAHREEVAHRAFDSVLLPSPHPRTGSVVAQTQGGNKAPWDAQLARRDAMRNARRGVGPPLKSFAVAARSPSPYAAEPNKAFSDTASALLDEQCMQHRVNLQLLFDTYGYRDFVSPHTNQKEGIISGAELHKLIWDAGIIASRNRRGVHPDVRDFFKDCVGNMYRETLKLSYTRFHTMLVRTVEMMAKQRHSHQSSEYLMDAARDLVRDYLTPLCHALFWTEAS